MSDAPQGSSLRPHASLLADASLVAAIVLAGIRCVVSVRTEFLALGDTAADIAIGPVGKLVADGLCALPLVGALVYRLRAGAGGAVVSLIAAGGAVAAALTNDWSIVSHWWAALALGLTAMLTVDVPHRKQLVAVTAAGLLFAMSVTAIHQFTLQHDANVEYYEQHRQQVLDMQGWAAGSREQVKYETRLYQREAVGAIGLSNVFGSVLAGALCIAAGLAAGVWRGRSPKVARAAVLIIALMGLVALGMTGSKGAAGALVMAGAAVAAAWWLSGSPPFGRGRGTVRPSGETGSGAAAGGSTPTHPPPEGEGRTRRAAAVYRVAAIGVVILGVAIVLGRLAVGPPDSVAGERSLLFRGQYLQAATAMIVDHPLTGVGEFKSAYLRYKNPLNPEDVADPHNVFAMWIATAGVAGWLWSAVIVIWLWRAAGCATALPAPNDAAKSGRALVWCTAIAAAGVFGFQWLVEVRAVSDNSQADTLAIAAYFAIMPTLAAMVTVLVARVVARHGVDGRPVAMGLFAAAVVIVLHGQLEMNLTNPMSAPLLCLLLGAAASVSGPAAAAKRGRVDVGATAAVIVTAVALAGWSFACAGRQADRVAHRDAIYRAYVESGDPARAFEMLSSDPAEHRLLVTLGHDAAQRAVEAGDADRAAGVLTRARALALGTATAFGQPTKGYRAAMYFSADLCRVTGEAGYGEQAVADGRKLLAAAPHSLDLHLFAADTAWELGRRDQARAWYRAALRIDEQSYLDPNSRMTDAERRRAARRAAPGPALSERGGGRCLPGEGVPRALRGGAADGAGWCGGGGRENGVALG